MDQEKQPNEMPWPLQSTDINPIENLFVWVKQILVKERPKTIAKLKYKLEKIWANIEPELTLCNMMIEGSGECINY